MSINFTYTYVQYVIIYSIGKFSNVKKTFLIHFDKINVLLLSTLYVICYMNLKRLLRGALKA